MLLTFLPLAGFAEDLDITRFTAANIPYGATDLPNVTVSAGTPEYVLNTAYEVSTVFYETEDFTGEHAVADLPTSGSGQYWLKITGKGTYAGQVYPLSFWIIGTDIAGATIADVAAVTYNGSEYKPEPAVTYNSNALEKGVNFTYSYEDNVDAGTATITITGMGNFSGTKTKEFTINKANIAAANVSTPPSAISGLEYTGQAQTLVQDGTLNGIASGNDDVKFMYKYDGDTWYAADAADIKKINAASNYVLTWKVAGGANYNDYVPTTNNTVTGVIDKAILVARAKAITTFYHGNLDASIIQIDYEDFVNGETTATADHFAAPTKSFSSQVTDASFAANTYNNGVVLTGGSADNYEIVTVNNTLTINPAKLQLKLLAGKTATFGTPAALDNEWPVTTDDITDSKFELKYQSDENTYTAVAAANVGTYLTLGTGDNAKVITGLKIKAAGNTEGAVNTDGYALTLEGGTAKANYTIDVRDANSKKLIINTGALTIKADNKVKIYGEADPTFSYSVVTGDATTITTTMDAAIKAALTRAQANTAAGEVAGNYIISFGEEGPEFDGFEITYQTGKLVIQKATLTITAKPQTLYTGNTEDDLGTTADYYIIEGLVTTANDATGHINDEANVTLGFAAAVETNGDDELTPHAAYNEGIKVTLVNEDALSANYKITKTPGTLTVVDLTTTLALLTNADNNAAIDAADGTQVNVTFGPREIKRETWVAMVLPFETSVTEISNKFGYAVVDIMDKAAYSGGDLHMKLWMGKIDANQPFLMKYYKEDVEQVLYTEATANAYNAELDLAKHAGEVQTPGEPATPAVYTVVPEGTDLTEGSTYYTSDTGDGEFVATDAPDYANVAANTYWELTSPGTPGTPDVLFTEATANAYNANLPGAKHAGDIKVAEEDNSKLNLNTVQFDGKLISSDEYEEVDPRGNIFFGVYAPTPVYGHEYAAPTKAGVIKRLGAFDASDPYTVVPTAGYFKMADAQARIFVEEPDGTTTVIKGITADGVAIPVEGWYTLNGVKLQGAPTEKGVYINNGKKVVLK